MWAYWLEAEYFPLEIVPRKTKPRIGSVITHAGRKWSVWYIEEGPGVRNARCELHV